MPESWQQRIDRLERQITALILDSAQLREQSRRYCAEARQLRARSFALLEEPRRVQERRPGPLTERLARQD